MRSTRSRVALVISVVFLLSSVPLVAFAASGDLDTTFDADGKVTTAFGPGGGVYEASNAYAVAIQGDGKIVAAGDCYVTGVSTDQDFCLARYNTNGSLDTGFDTDGKVITSIGTFDYPRAVAVQSDQKIVVAGYCVIGSTGDFCLARYNTDGTLDTGFDTDGKVTTPIGSANDAAYAVAIQGDGKIVAAGTCVIGSTDDVCLARYNTNGSLDTGFDTDGKVSTAIGTGTDMANAVAIQTSDGMIVVAGICVGAGFDFCLARYTGSGTLDAGFDGDGKVITAIASSSLSDFAYALAVQSDQRIVAAGYCDAGAFLPHDFCLARYNTDGTLDTGFDTDGKVLTPIGTTSDKARAVAVQSNGKLVVAGHCNNPGTDDFCLARYTSAGALDTTFGSAGTGTVFTAIGPHSDQAYAAAIQGDGKSVAAGACRTNTTDSTTVFCLARYDGDTTGVPTPAEMIAIINAEPLLTSGQKSALIAKLDDAQAAYAAGKVNTACGKLGSFIGQVEGLVPDKLSAQTAASLIAGANALKASYGCP